MFAHLQDLLIFVLSVAAFGFEVWALVEALRYTNEQYYASGKRNKAFWAALLGAAAAVGFLGLPYPLGQAYTGPLGLLGLVAVIVASVFFVDVRPALRSVSPRGPRRRDSRGGW